MNNEIKEISCNIRKIIKSNREDDFNRVIYDCDSLEKLLDYITNLQQENERLKEANVYCNRTDCVGRIKDSRKYDSVYQEKEDYKSRCEKASDNLKRNYWINEHEHNDDVVNMTLNILQGENNVSSRN